MADVAKRDENHVPTLLAVSSVDGISPVTLYADPVTHRLLVSSSGGGGAVSSVSNSDGTLTISPTTGAVVASLALAHANSWTATQTFTQTSLTAATVYDGFYLNNTTPATVGNQQYSGALHFTGQGWKTATTAGSQSVDFRQYVVPVQGATNPNGVLTIDSSINGGAYSTINQLDSGGNFTTQGNVVTTAGGFFGSAATIGGNVVIGNGIISTSATTTNATLNVVNGTGANNQTVAQYQYAGSTNNSLRTAFYGSFSGNASIGGNYSSVLFAGAPMTTPASGTNPWFSNVTINPIGTITSGGATLTNTASLYVGGAGTGGTNNYAVFIASGNSSFGGSLSASSISSQGSLAVTGVGVFSNLLTANNTNNDNNFQFSGSTATNTTGNPAVLIGGSSTLSFRNLMAGTTPAIVANGNSYASFTVGKNAAQIVTTGNNPIFANLSVLAPAITASAGSGTLTTAASVYIDAAPTGATNNYALYAAAGNSLFNGKVNVNGYITAGNATNNAIVYMGGDAGAYGTIQAANFANNSSMNLALNQFGGRVGIGATGMNGLLQIEGNISLILASQQASTLPKYMELSNTSGDSVFGINGATTLIYPGTTAYATIMGTANATPLQFVQNALLRMTIDTSGNIVVANGNLSLSTAGNKITIATGTNASVGTATLSSGTVTVSTTAVTASSKIFLTDATTGALTNIGTPTVGTITAGTSFVINSSNVLDGSSVNWLIIN